MANKKFRFGFTLIEVMVAVMIISIVILALMKMYGNSTYIFASLNKKTLVTQYGSFFVSNPKFGFEKQNTNLYELLSDFKIEDDLRRELKNKKIKLIYQELETIDMSESQEEDTQDVNATMIFEIGKSILKVDNSSVALMRLQIK